MNIQRLKVRQEATDETFPDQEVVIEGNKDDINFKEDDEWLKDL